MRSYRYLHLDVFTDRLFGGNQLAVVLDGRGLSSETMQAIAKEMNFSETTFVLPPERPDTDVRVRIFTPGEELPMAGHPTIGTHLRAGARGRRRAAGATRSCSGSASVRRRCRSTWKGERPELRLDDAAPPDLRRADRPIRRAPPRRCALPAAAVAGTGLPVQVVSCGVPFLLVPLTTRRAVDSAVADADALRCVPPRGRARRACRSSCSRPSQAPITAPCTAGCSRPAPASRKIRPPAAPAAPLGCYLVRHKVVTAERAGAMLSLQGVKMGRPEPHPRADRRRGRR